MRITSSILIIALLIAVSTNISYGKRISMRKPAPTPTPTNSYVYITPYASETSPSNIYGIGYTLPLDQCINVNGQNITLQQNSNNTVQLNYYNDCDSLINSQIYPLETLTQFDFIGQGGAYPATFSLTTNSMPANAIRYINFYQYVAPNNECHGPTFDIYFTNKYSTSRAKYYCDNGVPVIYVCTAGCEPMSYSWDCNDYDVNPFLLRC